MPPSPSPSRWPWLVGIAAVALAVAAALRYGEGQVDSTTIPDLDPVVVSPAGRGRSLPEPVFPAAFPAAARDDLLDAWKRAGGADDGDASVALRALLQGEPAARLRPVAADALRAMAPSLERLLLDAPEPLPSDALRLAARWSLDGGAAARAVLGETGLVERAIVVRALSGSTDLREETARFLGFLGGPAAAGRLALLAADPEPRVAGTAVLALGEIADRERLPPETVRRLMDVYDGNADPSVRRACLTTFRRAHRQVVDYGSTPREIDALSSPDAATRLVAATNQDAHPSAEAYEALVKALDDSDPRIVEAVAGALRGLLDARALEPLRRRREGLTDPAAAKAVDAAVRTLERLGGG